MSRCQYVYLVQVFGLPTFPRVWQVGDRLGHDNGHVDVALRIVHAKLDEDVVENVLHHIPIAHNVRAGLKGIPDVSSGGGVGVAVVTRKGEGPTQLAVPVLCHDRGNDEARLGLERPASAYGGGACIDSSQRGGRVWHRC